MTFEATITLDERHHKSVHVSHDEGEIWFRFGFTSGSAYTFMTAEQAREIAHALLDAAQEVEPEKMEVGTT